MCSVLIGTNKELCLGSGDGRRENWGVLGTYYVPVASLGVIIKCSEDNSAAGFLMTDAPPRGVVLVCGVDSWEGVAECLQGLAWWGAQSGIMGSLTTR